MCFCRGQGTPSTQFLSGQVFLIILLARSSAQGPFNDLKSGYILPCSRLVKSALYGLFRGTAACRTFQLWKISKIALWSKSPRDLLACASDVNLANIRPICAVLSQRNCANLGDGLYEWQVSKMLLKSNLLPLGPVLLGIFKQYWSIKAHSSVDDWRSK